MIRLERVVMGNRSQVFAAAYESVVMRGLLIDTYDPRSGRFTYRRWHHLSGVVVDVVIVVQPVDDTHVRVTVTAIDRHTRFGATFGRDRRDARRTLDDVEEAWSKPLRALAEPGWHRDPLRAQAQRYWDGQEWTPWVFWRDHLGLDWPNDPDHWVVMRAPSTFNLGRGGFVVRRRPRLALSPPIYHPGFLLGRRRIRTIVWKHRVLALVPLVLLVIGVGMFVWFLASSPPSTRPIPTVNSSWVAAITRRTKPIGAPHRYRDGVSVNAVGYQLTASESGATRDVDVEIEVCADYRGANVPGAVAIETANGRRHHGTTSTRAPTFVGGFLQGGCRRGWITVAIPSSAEPINVVWGGGHRARVRWRLRRARAKIEDENS